LLDDDWDAVEEAARHAHTSCVGYPQDPQVPHPAAPEYADALASHQRCRQAIWSVQRNRGYGVATMTPEFGPDGYLHTLPFTNHPVANLNQINAWMAATECQYFQQWKSVN
jgi:hypothetical protein